MEWCDLTMIDVSLNQIKKITNLENKLNDSSFMVDNVDQTPNNLNTIIT